MPKKQEEGSDNGGDDDDDDNCGKGSGSPRAYDPDAQTNTNPVIKSTAPIQKSPYTKVFNKYVEKFKIAAPLAEKKSMGNGYIALETGEINGKLEWICVFRNSIGKTLFSGYLNPVQSKYRRLIEKAYK
mmetsp:Transcript_37878/g.27887  ORF Transcript_37878/g.27887 Transcript_37878/m.27887 type:complete len:129 (-) Transcript_37878:263-649(-)|eukprot:CAMPEP_0202968008 /NCGR_PEP_ID=MMETSP1396-20130829/13106_1 /ASSEMBLY_ACC=CAM_ASM_000872 /TAXON_ID= /ORGANISM="Pseudokeronopsis sp., Strain Brazil" /LENGTH=128 /DNA_ID=CAMNT_0049693773 /DNA_START=588 /DNA_END=977 /DNA_ORIENTATION=-